MYAGVYFWFGTPTKYASGSAIGFNVYVPTMGRNDSVSFPDYGIRPVVSLKHDVELVEGGDGTGSNPYVVKYDS